MSAQLPRPSASAGAATSGRAVIRGKMGIATQRQRERAMLLAQADKSREPAIDKTRSFNHSAPATPSSVERAHRLLQCSAMKQVDVALRARTMSPVFELPATIPEIPPTVERAASPVLEAARRRRQRGGSGGSTAAALAARWRRWQRGGSVSRSSTAAARRKRAARRRHLQRGVSGRSAVAVLAERRRQRGSGAATAGSAAEASAAQGRRRQRSGGGDEQWGSRVTGRQQWRR